MSKPKLGIYAGTCCAGCQLAIIDCEDELLAIADLFDIKSFIMAQTGNEEGELDIALFEGSICNDHDKKMLEDVRKRSKLLIALGTCACWGGVAASRNDIPPEQHLKDVYGADADKVKAFSHPVPHEPLYKYVKVDYSIPGCPIEKDEFLKAVTSLLHGDVPELTNVSVCAQCKFKENPCQIVDYGRLCCGPVTRAGCGARCPSQNQLCDGCRGPVDEANVASELDLLFERGFTREDILARLTLYARPAEAFTEYLANK
jgi:sulfhydrogenase subunit delta